MKDTFTLRPLTRTRKDNGSVYVREKDVEAQLRHLATLNERERRRAFFAEGEERLREEALVYVLRERATAGDDETAWQIAQLLVDRISGHVARQLSKWRLPPDDADDCTRDLFATLFEALFDGGPGGEFWEVRFWVCLDRRLWNLIEKRQTTLDAELREVEAPGGDGGERSNESGLESLLSRVKDTSVGPEERAILSAALEHLTENERLAIYLTKIEGLPEESDDPDRVTAATILGVTGRSVRNYLKRAEEKVQKWEQAR
jgi:DNA-directed RNA polymerase specialized sigma24 family protein